jgi:hypothetical protein
MPTCVERYRSPPFGEERLDDGGTVCGEDSGGNFHSMV